MTTGYGQFNRLYLLVTFALGSLQSLDAIGQPMTPIKLSLAEAISRSRQHNEELEATRKERDAAHSAKAQATSAFLPTVSAELSAGTRRDLDPTRDDPAPETARDYNAYSGALVLRQNIFRGFADIAAHKKAATNVKSRELKIVETTQNLRQQVMNLYFELQLIATKIVTAEAIASSKAENIELVRARLRSGQITELDVLKAEFDWESQKPEIESLKVDLEKKRYEFAELVSIPIEQSFELATSLESAFELVSSSRTPQLAEVVANALKSNATIQRIRLDLETLDRETEIRRGNHLPKVDFVLKGESFANTREDIGAPNSRKVSGVIELSVPLFTGLTSLQQRSESANQAAALELHFAAEKRRLVTKLNGALSDLRLSRTRAEIGKSNRDLAKRTRIQTTVQYKAGKSPISAVLDAYQLELDAANEYSEALFSGIKATSAIQQMIGAEQLETGGSGP